MSRSGCFLAEEEYVADILSWVMSRESRQPASRSPQLFRLKPPSLPCLPSLYGIVILGGDS